MPHPTPGKGLIDTGHFKISGEHVEMVLVPVHQENPGSNLR